MFDYATIKALAQETGRRVNDLIALARDNDPFYVGTPAHIAAAQWFAGLWGRFTFPHGVHLRRIHYTLVSQALPVVCPDGKPYVNTEGCWDFLGEASKGARYLNLVDPGAFTDRRNPPPVLYLPGAVNGAGITLTGRTPFVYLPDFPSLPSYDLHGPPVVQRTTWRCGARSRR